MSDQANKRQTKDAKQEKITELTDQQLDVAGGGIPDLNVFGPSFGSSEGDDTDALKERATRGGGATLATTGEAQTAPQQVGTSDELATEETKKDWRVILYEDSNYRG